MDQIGMKRQEIGENFIRRSFINYTLLQIYGSVARSSDY
jgi:hypothetical protein